MAIVEKRIPHEIHPFKVWEGGYLDTKPRTTPYDSDEGTYSPPSRSVKGMYKSEWWWFTPNGVPFMKVTDKTAWTVGEQRADLFHQESQLKSIANEGMVGVEDFNTDRDSGKSTMRKLKKDPNGDIRSISADDYDLFYGD